MVFKKHKNTRRRRRTTDRHLEQRNTRLVRRLGSRSCDVVYCHRERSARQFIVLLLLSSSSSERHKHKSMISRNKINSRFPRSTKRGVGYFQGPRRRARLPHGRDVVNHIITTTTTTTESPESPPVRIAQHDVVLRPPPSRKENSLFDYYFI